MTRRKGTYFGGSTIISPGQNLPPDHNTPRTPGVDRLESHLSFRIHSLEDEIAGIDEKYVEMALAAVDHLVKFNDLKKLVALCEKIKIEDTIHNAKSTARAINTFLVRRKITHISERFGLDFCSKEKLPKLPLFDRDSLGLFVQACNDHLRILRQEDDFC